MTIQEDLRHKAYRAGFALAALMAGVLAPVFAAPTDAVVVSHAWARATVPGQTASGAFMELRSEQAAQLTGVRTPVAGIAQVHEMKIEGTRMSMRPIASLALPAKSLVELKPDGLHVMLMDLKQPLAAGQHFPLTLELSDQKGQKSEETVDVEVRSLASPQPR